MLAFVTHGSRSRNPGSIAPRPAAPLSGQRRGLGFVVTPGAITVAGDPFSFSGGALGTQLFNNALAAGTGQAGAGPLMSPAVSVSAALPWSVAPIVPGAPAGAPGITEIALGTAPGCGCGGSCGCDDSHSAGKLFGLPWWVWACGVGVVAYEGGR